MREDNNGRVDNDRQGEDKGKTMIDNLVIINCHKLTIN